MPDKPTETACDVLVVGSGIAGVTAALEAARSGARTVLASLGPLFSGSSFYPGTWGLGLIAPLDDADTEDLARTILRIGCGMASPALVRTLARGVRPAIDRLEALGATLKRPDQAGEREFVPCFDHKERLWRGILREPCERALARALEHAGVRSMEGRELMGLDASSDGVRGAVLYDRERAVWQRVSCRAVVLACGGTGGLFERRLTGADVVGTAHAIALAHGARLVNMEFLQIMPGIVSPCAGVVFNEKAFRFMEFDASPAARQLTGRTDFEQIMAQRSGYGPFTARLASRAVDAAIDAAGPGGLAMRYRAEAACGMPARTTSMPELVRDYYDWLERAYGVRPHDWVRVAPYAHAANGGILIDEHGATGAPGLYACGEATGGMHGADRIGGLSSANGLVFGAIAGKSAAAWALAKAAACATPHAEHTGADRAETRDARTDAGRPTATGVGSGQGQAPARSASPTARLFARAEAGGADPTARALRQRLQRALSAHCMIARTEEGLSRAESELADIMERADALLSSDAATVDALRLRYQAMTARSLVAAMRARRESRGAHYRADFPEQDARFDRPFAVAWSPAANAPRCEPFSWRER